MKTAKINRLKIVLVEQGEKQEMACRAVSKERGNHFTVVFQCKPAFFGNANEDSIHIRH